MCELIEHKDNMRSNPVTKRIFDILQDLLEFIWVVQQILFELISNLVQKFMPVKLKDVSGEIVLITGTGHGIGRELAFNYTALGSTVICVDINEKNNEDTVQNAKKLEQGSVFGYVCDVSNRDAVMALANKIKSEIGKVSILINNVGIMPTHSLEEHTADEIRRVFDINVLSQIWTIQAFLPQMKEQGRGHILAMSSIAGIVGLSNLVPYCASKFAVRGLMEALHEELHETPYKNLIKTTIIYPYMTNTGLCKRPKVKFPSWLGLLDPRDVAKFIVRAQRSNVSESTIPTSLIHINNWCRLLPLECGQLLKDYIDSGVESDL